MKVVPEPSERCTTVIACGGSLARIELLDRRIVPGLDLAEEDRWRASGRRARARRLDAFDVDDRHDAAHHRRELDEAGLLELLGLQRHVGAPKVTVLA